MDLRARKARVIDEVKVVIDDSIWVVAGAAVCRDDRAVHWIVRNVSIRL